MELMKEMSSEAMKLELQEFQQKDMSETHIGFSKLDEY